MEGGDSISYSPNYTLFSCHTLYFLVREVKGMKKVKKGKLKIFILFRLKKIAKFAGVDRGFFKLKKFFSLCYPGGYLKEIL